jgi:hypothetical protein
MNMNDEIIEDASNLWSEGKEDDAIALLSPLATEGNTKAKANLGLILCHYYKNEKFIKIEEGEKLLAEACEAGEPSACHNLWYVMAR